MVTIATEKKIKNPLFPMQKPPDIRLHIIPRHHPQRPVVNKHTRCVPGCPGRIGQFGPVHTIRRIPHIAVNAASSVTHCQKCMLIAIHLRTPLVGSDPISTMIVASPRLQNTVLIRLSFLRAQSLTRSTHPNLLNSPSTSDRQYPAPSGVSHPGNPSDDQDQREMDLRHILSRTCAVAIPQ